jgi:tetratricopeptide (TPR) repeat protein
MSKKSAKSSQKTVSAQKTAAARSQSGLFGTQNGGFFRRNRVAVILFIACFVVYGNSIFNGYALDDEFYTAGSNKLTQQGFKGIPKIFDSRTFYNNDGSGYSYRPIAVSSFAIEIQFFGEHARVSHFINVLLYAITIVLLFGLLKRWFKAQGDWFAFFVTLIFLVHPLHTEVVANIKCRDELLSFLFSVLTLRLIFIRFLDEGKKWAIAVAALTFGFALLSKTSCIPMYIMLPIALWYFGGMNIKKAALFLVPLIAVGLFIKFALIHRLPEMSRTLQGFENPLLHAGFTKLSATAMYVLGRFVWLHFIPHPLIFYYGLNAIPLCSWSDPIVLVCLVVVLALATLTIIELRKKTVAGFGLAWCAANLMMFSNLFGPTPGLFAERFAYAASLGFVIAIADYIFRFTKTSSFDFKWKLPAYSRVKWIFVVVAIIFSLRSIARNEAWEDKETLYRNDVELVPESAKMNMLLASLLSAKAAEMNYRSTQYFYASQQYAQAGRQQEAAVMRDSSRILHDNAYAMFRESRTYYLQATDVFPDYYTAWSNLGTAYYFTQEYRGGIPYFKKAIEINPDYAEGYFNLGMTYEQLSLKDGSVADTSLLDSSIYFFDSGISKDPKYINTSIMLGRVYFQHLKDTSRAFNVLRLALKDNPDSPEPWNSMSKIYIQLGDTIKGLACLERSAEIIITKKESWNQEESQVLNQLATYFYQRNNQEKYQYYNSAIQAQNAAVEKRRNMVGGSK